MGLHQRHTHGRVFHGEEAREQLKIRKRDSHGSEIRMHVPEGFERRQLDSSDSDAGSDDSGAAYSIVYVTLPQTFEGPAMYSTMTEDYVPQATNVRSANGGVPNFYSGETTSEAVPFETSIATVIPNQSLDGPARTTFATEPTVAASLAGGTPVQATSAASPGANLSQQNQGSSEMSGGAKAGLAFGIIFSIAAACALVWFCWRRKRTVKHSEVLNEKHGSFADVGARRAEANGGNRFAPISYAVPAVAAGAGATVTHNKRDSSMTEKVPSSPNSTRTASTAPRLSLRPVTQMFMPSLNNNAANNNAANNEKSASGQNPFADASSVGDRDARPNSPPSDPFQDQRRSNETQNDSAVAAGAAGVAAAAAGVAAAHQPSSPGSAHSGPAGAVPVAAPGPNGPATPRQPNNVHRVQLDFKPSMDDELELRSGQLVRLLHEYDDGWALCIRMDRSQQGVAPRTCLSKLPVKPRPQGPPPNGPHGSHGRPGQGPPPQGARRPSNAPAPQGMPGAAVPRPLTPQSSRTPSPPHQRVSGDSSSSQKSVPARKPVPGQAM